MDFASFSFSALPFVRVILSVAEIRAKRGSNGESAVWDLGRKENAKRHTGGASGTSPPTGIAVRQRAACFVCTNSRLPLEGKLPRSG